MQNIHRGRDCSSCIYYKCIYQDTWYLLRSLFQEMWNCYEDLTPALYLSKFRSLRNKRTRSAKIRTSLALIVFSIFLYPHADESVEKWSLQSTDSSKNVHGYLADRENSSSLSSLQVHVSETYNEGSLEKAFEMGGDHKFLEGKIKLIVRPYSEPVLFPFDDKFSPNEVESLRKKLTSCSTKHIDNNEACCKSLSVGGMLLFFHTCSNNVKEIKKEVFLSLHEHGTKKKCWVPHGDSAFFSLSHTRGNIKKKHLSPSVYRAQNLPSTLF